MQEQINVYNDSRMDQYLNKGYDYDQLDQIALGYLMNLDNMNYAEGLKSEDKKCNEYIAAQYMRNMRRHNYELQQFAGRNKIIIPGQDPLYTFPEEFMEEYNLTHLLSGNWYPLRFFELILSAIRYGLDVESFCDPEMDFDEVIKRRNYIMDEYDLENPLEAQLISSGDITFVDLANKFKGDNGLYQFNYAVLVKSDSGDVISEEIMTAKTLEELELPRNLRVYKMRSDSVGDIVTKLVTSLYTCGHSVDEINEELHKYTAINYTIFIDPKTDDLIASDKNFFKDGEEYCPYCLSTNMTITDDILHNVFTEIISLSSVTLEDCNDGDILFNNLLEIEPKVIISLFA